MIRRADNPWPGSVVEPLSLHYTGDTPLLPHSGTYLCHVVSGAPAGMLLPPATAKMTPRAFRDLNYLKMPV